MRRPALVAAASALVITGGFMLVAFASAKRSLSSHFDQAVLAAYYTIIISAVIYVQLRANFASLAFVYQAF